MSGSITDLFLLAGGDAGYPLRRPKARCMSAADHLSPCSPEEEEEDEEGEETDSFRGVPLRRSCRLRTSFQSHDSFRRHSWEPGKELRSQQDYEERSASLKGLDPDEIENSMGRRQDPRRVPIIHSNEELESFFSLEEEGQAKRLPGARVPSQYFGGASLSKSVSMTGIDHAYSSQEDVSFFAPGRHLANGFGSLSQLDAVESGDKENERREESTLERTLSFIKKKVAGGKAKPQFPDALPPCNRRGLEGSSAPWERTSEVTVTYPGFELHSPFPEAPPPLQQKRTGRAHRTSNFLIILYPLPCYNLSVFIWFYTFLFYMVIVFVGVICYRFYTERI